MSRSLQAYSLPPADGDPARCPLCGGPNNCRLCTNPPDRMPCWCAAESFPPELLARVPRELLNRACVCHACLTAFRRERGFAPVAARATRLLPRTFVALAALITFATTLLAGTFNEDFAVDPAGNGWSTFGSTNLFHWNPTNQNLEVTWDSSQSNSYFHRPLGTILGRYDDFSLSFDLRLEDILVAGYFELAIGFANLQEATQPDFSRATANSPDLVEFTHFGDGGFGPTTCPVVISSDLEYAPYKYNAYRIGLPLHQTIHVAMNYTATNQTLATILSTNGTQLAHLADVKLDSTANSQFAADSDFRVNMVSIASYTATDDPFGNSLLAHGTVDNVTVVTPPSPIQNLTGALSNQVWRVEFLSRSNWLYTLERSPDLQSWSEVAPPVAGNATNLLIEDTTGPADKAFYRVRAERP